MPIVRNVNQAEYLNHLLFNQSGKVIVKFFWWPLFISVGLSLLLTLIVNLIARHQSGLIY